MNTVLITGGAGFVGSHLVAAIYDSKRVIVIDDLSNGSLRNLGPEKGEIRRKIVFYHQSILNAAALEDILKKEDIDTCIHLAARISVQDSIVNPGSTVTTNILGTHLLLEACARRSVKNFVFASTGAVYGEPKKLPIVEHDELNPLSPYGASKVSGEALVSSYRNTNKIPNALSLRFFNIYGKRQSPQYAGVITKFAERLSKGLPPIIYGDGEQTREFVSVNDVVNAIVLAAGSKKIDVTPVFNVATGIPITISDLARLMTKEFRVDIDPIYEDERIGDIKNAKVDITKIRETLGYKPQTILHEGLRSMLSELIPQGVALK
jgi:UDP-glucose 4-epimerase